MKMAHTKKMEVILNQYLTLAILHAQQERQLPQELHIQQIPHYQLHLP